jgi:hypothetical protein
MKIFELLGNLTKYITEGFARIFSPNRDEYPEVGVQPFEGDTYQEGTDKQ